MHPRSPPSLAAVRTPSRAAGCPAQVCDLALRPTLTFTGIALSDQTNHQGCAVAALGGAGEGLDAELVCFRLQEKTSKTNQVTGNQGEVGQCS